MINFPLRVISLFIISTIFGITSCSQDEEQLISSSNEAESIYQYLINQPTITLLSSAETYGKNAIQYIPEFSEEDKRIISSMSQDEFKILKDSLMYKLGGYSEEELDEIAIENYIKIFNILNGQKGISELLNFASAYLHTYGGINNIKKLIPTNLNKIETICYVSMAVYVDKLARPIYSIMSNDNVMVSDDNKDSNLKNIGNCKWEAETKLLLAGVEFGLDTLIEIMTGGVDTEGYIFEDGLIFADLERIYYEYEVCMGRWH